MSGIVLYFTPSTVISPGASPSPQRNNPSLDTKVGHHGRRDVVHPNPSPAKPGYGFGATAREAHLVPGASQAFVTIQWPPNVSAKVNHREVHEVCHAPVMLRCPRSVQVQGRRFGGIAHGGTCRKGARRVWASRVQGKHSPFGRCLQPRGGGGGQLPVKSPRRRSEAQRWRLCIAPKDPQ